MKFSVLTWNIRDIPYPFRSSSEAYRKRRGVADFLYSGSSPAYDAVLLQEAFDPAQRRRIVADVSGYLSAPEIQEKRSAFWYLPFVKFDATGGLLTLSKHPILHSEFRRFQRQGHRWDERICQKGYTKTALETPIGEIVIDNLHLCSWSANSYVRLDQLKQVLAEQKSEGAPTFMGGDFNMYKIADSGTKSEEFEAVEAAGFRDSLAGPEWMFHTYCVENPLAGESDLDDLSVAGKRVSRRLDYVFFREGNGVRIKPVRSGIVCMHDPVSDHFGYSAEFEIEKQ